MIRRCQTASTGQLYSHFSFSVGATPDQSTVFTPSPIISPSVTAPTSPVAQDRPSAATMERLLTRKLERGSSWGKRGPIEYSPDESTALEGVVTPNPSRAASDVRPTKNVDAIEAATDMEKPDGGRADLETELRTLRHVMAEYRLAKRGEHPAAFASLDPHGIAVVMGRLLKTLEQGVNSADEYFSFYETLSEDEETSVVRYVQNTTYLELMMYV